MTIQQFQSTLHYTPFRPFTIHMADGRTVRVSHPDFVARSPSGRTVVIYDVNDNHSILDLLLMTELEVHDSNERAA